MSLSTDRWAKPYDRLTWGLAPPLLRVSREEDWHRRFCAYFHFVGWDCLSLGIHIAWCQPNIEVHVPFGFFRLGWKYGPWRCR